MKKKITVLLLVVVMLVASVGVLTAFSGCTETESEFKVGVLHINPVTSTSGYTYAHQQGIEFAKKELGLKDSQILIKDNLPDTQADQINTAIEDLIAQGCNMIIGTSFGYMEELQAYAEQYPEIVFSHGTGYLDTYGEGKNNNMNNYFGRIYQDRYLSGLVAGLNTKTGHLGYVSAFGTTVAECSSGINAFTLGAQAAAKLRTDLPGGITVHVMTLNSWFDIVNEKAHAETLIKQFNCDVITQHCDTEGPSDAAKKNGVYSIGYNSDMAVAVANEGEERNSSVLTSVLWNWGAYYKTAIETAMKCFDENGKFVSIDPWKEFGNYYGDYTDGLYKLAPLSTECVEGTADIVALVQEMMLKGTDEWDVFSNKELSFVKGEDGKYTVEIVDSPLYKNDGTLVGEVTVANITGDMPYFVKGVVLENAK